MKYKRINTEVEAKQFPDNGPEQQDVAKWVRGYGCEAHLYDGEFVSDVKTSTNANWRWLSVNLHKSSASVGDWIVKEGEFFSVYTDEEFNLLWTPLSVTNTSTQEEIYDNLCHHDRRNPYWDNDEEYNEENEDYDPNEKCYCNNCHFKRTKLAEEVLKLTEDLLICALLSADNQ
jgi:hypothetical protein